MSCFLGLALALAAPAADRGADPSSAAATGAAPEEAPGTASDVPWSLTADIDLGNLIASPGEIVQLTLGAENENEFAVDDAEGVESLGEIVRARFGGDHLLSNRPEWQINDAVHWTAATRVVVTTASLFTADGLVHFTWGFRSTTTLTPIDEHDGDPVTVNLFRPMGLVTSPVAAEAIAIEVATRLPGLLEPTDQAGIDVITWWTPTGGWQAYFQCIQNCLTVGYAAHYDNLLTCLRAAGVVVLLTASACHIGCGFIAVPCILACLGVALPASGTAAAACITAYIGGLSLIPAACAVFCW